MQKPSQKKKKKKHVPWKVWPSWLECHPINRKAVVSIPTQGTRVGCRFGPGWGTYNRQLMFLSLPSPLKSIGMSLGED